MSLSPLPTAALKFAAALERRVLHTLPAAAREAAGSAEQLVAVVCRRGGRARLSFYEREADGSWTRRFTARALIGRNGIGKTREGDGKTPAGCFALSSPFGLLEDPGCRMPGYVRVTECHYWSGASGTADYNRMIDTRERPDYRPGANDERLCRYPGLYDYALFIGYNSDGEPGAGSAIFLHCMGGSDSTGGCVAIDRARMKTLLTTLDEGAVIVIYER